MLRKLSILFFVLFLVDRSVGAGDYWDYLSTQYGVDAWANNFQACNGSKQSPIDIKNATYSNLGDIQFTNYGAIPSSVVQTVTNNNHTNSISFTNFPAGKVPTISNGGLPGTFALAGMHFHWGDDNSRGSEHHVNNKSYPAELHAVHLNTKYSNVSEGVQKADGLAVLGVLIERGRYNPNYNFLNLTTNNVTYPGMKSNLSISSLMGLLPSDKSFYRYNGSLTTPKCQEAVTWTVFAEPVEISDAEFFALRDMKFIDKSGAVQRLVDNHRTIQPLNDRQLLANFNATTTTPTATMATGSSSTMATGSSSTMTTGGSPTITTTTDDASGISQNYFMILASSFLILFTFLEI